MEPGITWYDVLGAAPDAEASKIKRKYDDKAALLRPELISGAPSNVVTAVTRAQHMLDTTWEVLGDPESRKRYDEAIGLRRSGGGLGQPGTGSESAGMAPADLGIVGGLADSLLGGLLELLPDQLAPRRRRNRPGAVPDGRGLFYPVCQRPSATRASQTPSMVQGADPTVSKPPTIPDGPLHSSSTVIGRHGSGVWRPLRRHSPRSARIRPWVSAGSWKPRGLSRSP